jgi:5-methyltetrahydrofolate--homocysteine methyltransferase
LREQLLRRVLLCDGAMGTELMARGLVAGVAGETWNLDHPGDVEAIHRAYAAAGCDLLTTNSFGGSAISLRRHGLDGKARELNLEAARIARQAAGDRAFVLGDIGPCGEFLEPLGELTPAGLSAVFHDQAAALCEGGADGIIIETMGDVAELAAAVAAAKQVSDWPVFATFAFGRGEGAEFRTMMGTPVADALGAAVSAGADVVGANCGTGLDLPDYLRLAQALVAAAKATGTTVILQPNAGAPAMVNDKLTYPASPADMIGLIAPLVKMGVRVIGGCCGTSPKHLAAMAAAIKIL